MHPLPADSPPYQQARHDHAASGTCFAMYTYKLAARIDIWRIKKTNREIPVDTQACNRWVFEYHGPASFE